MEATTSKSRIGGNSAGQLLASRRGGAIIAVLAAVIAGGLLYLFVQQYRKSVDTGASQTSIFVASGFIPHGTPASVISSQNLLQRTSVKQSQSLSGAITDPSQLANEVAVKDIAPGQQLRASDFAPGNPTLSSYLSGTGRAIALPVDSTHGLNGYISPGDHVDILWSASGGNVGGVTTIAQDVTVIAIAGGGGGGIGGGGGGTENVIVKTTDKIALALAMAADNGKVWLLLRPPVGAQQTVGVGQKVGK